MISVAEIPKMRVLLYMPETATWQKMLVSALKQDSEFVSVLKESTSAEKTRSQLADATIILCFDTPQSILFFEQELPRLTYVPHRVIIARSPEAVVDERLNRCANMVLPPYEKAILKYLAEYQLLKRESLKLMDSNRALMSQIEALKQELKRHQRSSGEMEILKNAIVQNVSHELKTPLLQVKSAVALLAEDIEDSRLIQYATEATARLETIVRNITMLGSSFDIHIGLVIVRDAVEYARRNLGRVWLHRNEAARIKIELEDNLPPVRADKQGLSTVLQLLMDNALKFSEKEIYVQAKQEGDYVTISVRDYGIGIAKEELDKIFESFYQVDNSSTRRFGGVGIGLALVKLILDHHGVEISVKSEVGKGSQFYFQLPSVKIQPDKNKANEG